MTKTHDYLITLLLTITIFAKINSELKCKIFLRARLFTITLVLTIPYSLNLHGFFIRQTVIQSHLLWFCALLRNRLIYQTNWDSLARLLPRFASAICTFASSFDWFTGLSITGFVLWRSIIDLRSIILEEKHGFTNMENEIWWKLNSPNEISKWRVKL